MKSFSRITVLATLLAVFATAPQAFSQGAESQLHQVIFESGQEQAKARELENKALEEKDRKDRRLRQVQKEIAEQRYQIQGFKMRQEKAEQELEMLKVDHSDLDSKLQSLKSERAAFEYDSNATIADLDNQKREFTEKQKAYETEIAELNSSRKRAERSITNKSIEVQELKAAAAGLEATKAEIESKTAEMEADEMRVRSEWMRTKLEAAEMAKAREEANARLAEAKNRRDKAIKELNVAQVDLAKAQKERGETAKRVQSEVARYEKEIQAAHKARITSESEQIRLEAEAAKIREYSYRMKESHEQALDQANQSDSLVWKSTLNLETARSELARSVSARDRDGYTQSKDMARARGMQDAAEAANLLEAAKVTLSGRAVATAGPSNSKPNQRSWVTSSQCDAFAKPSKSAPKMGVFAQGERFSATNSGKGWVKIQSDSGATAFVEGSCGKYED